MNQISLRSGRALLASMAILGQLVFAQAAIGPIEGHWGGDRLQLTLDANGGRVELGCASGAFAGPVTPGADGSFTAAGTFEEHRPGPQRADEAPAVAEAQFAGVVRNGAMTLSILLVGASAPQVFHLRSGAVVKQVRCL